MLHLDQLGSRLGVQLLRGDKVRLKQFSDLSVFSGGPSIYVGIKLLLSL